MARATSDTQPTVNRQQLANDQPSRAATEANVISSPTPVNSPSQTLLAGQDSSDQPQPSATALSHARQGTAGAGQAANLDEAAPAPDDLPRTIASAAARRVTATQVEAGPAIAPQQASRTRQTRAGAAAPNAVMPSEEIAVAQVVGSETPSDLQASSSAALTDARANAERGVNASPGPVEVDIGPTRIVANTGQGRASGGGQPTLNFEPSNNDQVRSSASTGKRPSVASTNVSEIAQSPVGGQAEPEVAPSASSASSVAASSGGALPTSMESRESADAIEPAGGSPNVAAQAPARASSIDAPQTSIANAGGGTQGPTRQLPQRPSAILTPSEEVDVAGLLQSSGDPDGSNLQAQGAVASRSAAGLAGPISDQEVGNLADEAMMDGESDLVNRMLAALERSSAMDEDGPSPADLINLGGPIGRSTDVPAPSVQASELVSNLDLPTDTKRRRCGRCRTTCRCPVGSDVETDNRFLARRNRGTRRARRSRRRQVAGCWITNAAGSGRLEYRSVSSRQIRAK